LMAGNVESVCEMLKARDEKPVWQGLRRSGGTPGCTGSNMRNGKPKRCMPEVEEATPNWAGHRKNNDGPKCRRSGTGMAGDMREGLCNGAGIPVRTRSKGNATVSGRIGLLTGMLAPDCESLGAVGAGPERAMPKTAKAKPQHVELCRDEEAPKCRRSGAGDVRPSCGRPLDNEGNPVVEESKTSIVGSVRRTPEVGNATPVCGELLVGKGASERR